MKRLFISIALAVASLGAPAATAQAAPVLIGSPLTNFPTNPLFTSCPPPACTFTHRALPNATLVSPVDGAVVRWHLLGASSTSFSLQVLSFVGNGPQASEPEYEAVSTSAPVTPAGARLETFPAALPIAAGQAVGLKVEGNGGIGGVATAGARVTVFAPPLLDGAVRAGRTGATDLELGFNAEIQPAPSLTSVTPAKGPLAGGNEVTLEGTQFADVKGVRFGTAPARGFSVGSEGRITATPPAVQAATTVAVSVTTVAGTATLPAAYAYEKTSQEAAEEQKRREEEEHERAEEQRRREEARDQGRCTVPKLRGKRLAVARKLLGRAHCAVGRVSRRKGAKPKTGKVVAQRPKPGTVRPAGAKVALTLGRTRR
jgi:IPT/TIG domain/PASTA domain